jgi:hypothetical protein
VIQDDFTIEAWIKTSTPSPTGTNFYDGAGIVYADVPAMTDDFGTSILNNHLAIGTGNPDATLEGNTDVTTGAWVHVAATRTRNVGRISVVVNGVQETVLGSIGTNSLTAPLSMTLGGSPITGLYFTGVMDEVRIWNVARSAAEIFATMHTRLTGTEPGLVGYWRFDENGGQTAADASSSHNDATFTGTPAWVPSTAPLTACP